MVSLQFTAPSSMQAQELSGACLTLSKKQSGVMGTSQMAIQIAMTTTNALI
jgi:hypothetical protein